MKKFYSALDNMLLAYAARTRRGGLFCQTPPKEKWETRPNPPIRFIFLLFPEAFVRFSFSLTPNLIHTKKHSLDSFCIMFDHRFWEIT